MKNIAKTVAVLLLAVLPVFAFSQEKKKLFREVREIVSVENDGSSDVMVFSMPENGQDHYYLSVGTLGAGDRIIQFNIDPFSTPPTSPKPTSPPWPPASNFTGSCIPVSCKLARFQRGLESIDSQ